MKTPIIGIVTRSFISYENHKISIIYDDIINSIVKNGGIPIGIKLDNNFKKIISFCDGIIFQGGDDFEEFDIETVKYLYAINKPVLGVCLGMQLMGMTFDGKMIDIKDHKKNLEYAHEVKIKKNSKLYNIFKANTIKVNSRHKSVIATTNLDIVGISNDGFIEAIEDSNKKFFIGVQWHPESMIEYNNLQDKLFSEFIKSTLT